MNLKIQTIFNIRDARDLCAEEKAILYAVATRGEAWGSWEKVAGDAGLSKGRFYKYRARLESIGVLLVEERPGTTTLCRVDEGRLEALVPTSTLPGNPETLPVAGDSTGEETEGEVSGKPDNPLPGNPEAPFPGNPEQKETSKETIQGDKEDDLKLHRPSKLVSVWDEARLIATCSDDDAA
ncbi:MAG: hypothetical protein NTX33_19945 [Propionibacteriales bacterium]|nr:hypothetical protein [Propionibacteriales bacterium]